MLRKLGKLPARPDAVRFKFGAFFNAAALPTPPLRFGHFGAITEWGAFANDRYSDCVFAGAAHEAMIWLSEAGESAAFNDQCVLADYAAVTGFNPADPSSDQGTDMQAAADYRRKVGIVDASGRRHKVDAYVALNAGDVDQLALAAYLFGAVGIGIQLPSSAEGQFDQQVPWSVVPGDRIAGGHYVPVIGRNKLGNFLVITWGRLHAATPDFIAQYMDEGICYLSLESLKNNLSPEGFNATQLQQDLAAIAAQPKGSAMADQSVQGTTVDQGEIDAVFIAIKNLADEKVPGWERGMISDDLLREVSAAAVTASVEYRTAKTV